MRAGYAGASGILGRISCQLANRHWGLAYYAGGGGCPDRRYYGLCQVTGCIPRTTDDAVGDRFVFCVLLLDIDLSVWWNCKISGYNQTGAPQCILVGDRLLELDSSACWNGVNKYFFLYFLAWFSVPFVVFSFLLQSKITMRIFMRYVNR